MADSNLLKPSLSFKSFARPQTRASPRRVEGISCRAESGTPLGRRGLALTLISIPIVAKSGMAIESLFFSALQVMSTWFQANIMKHVAQGFSNVCPFVTKPYCTMKAIVA